MMSDCAAASMASCLCLVRIVAQAHRNKLTAHMCFACWISLKMSLPGFGRFTFATSYQPPVMHMLRFNNTPGVLLINYKNI